jgi:hypothetical protein
MRRLILVSLVFAASAVAIPRQGFTGETRALRLILRDGSSKVVQLSGVGCDESLCSRVAVRGRVDGDARVTATWFDTIAEIHDVRRDQVAMTLKDGTTRHLAIIPDNRVIYFVDQRGREQKLALSNVRSAEFLAR